MAARRLLLVMLLLLVISSLAAALVPPPPQRDGTTTETTTAKRGKPPPAPPQAGRLVRESVSARGRPRRIALAPGDQLSLRVTSPRFVQVTIPTLGLLDSAGPGSPARFSLLAPRPGSHPVRPLAGGRTIARIIVRRPEKAGR